MAGQPAAAQGWRAPDPTEPWTAATLKFGPFFVAPSFDVRNVGIDNNVFRDRATPRQDLTATMAVSTIFGAHIRAFSLMVTQDNRYIWFRRYTSERSIDGGLRAIAELRLASMRPWITWAKPKSHDRTGYEIDARAGHETPMWEAGSDFNFGLRTGVTVSFSNQRQVYEEDQFYDGVDLKHVLDNRTAFAHVNGKWQYSDYTDMVAGVEWTRNQFVHDPIRNADTVSYFGGFQSHGDAPILGRAQVGYKRQRHEDPNVPDFRGLVGGAALSTVVFDRLKLDLDGDRDLNYSYDDTFPFYVQQGGGLTVTGRLSTRFDVIVSSRAEWLQYSQNFIDNDQPVAARTDRATVMGLGFMYTMGGNNSHFGLTLERADRVSPIARKNYRNNRVLTNIKFSF